jgi:phenylpyruvate tautomerase PptA (4-oxalocrotonate tautomerase family)
MPLVTIKVFKDELSDSQAKDLIHKVTETVIPFVGEKLRDNTWVRLRKSLADPGELAEKPLVLKMFARFSHGSEQSTSAS